MSDTYRRLKFDIRTFLGKYPGVFLPFLAWRRRKRVHRHWLQPQIYTPETQLVVEGYPRCGNTFSIAALHVATDGDLPRLAHHIHLPAQVIQAVRDRKPAIVLIREPIDAMASTLVHDPRLGPLQVLRAYNHFYEPLIPFHRDYVVADFSTVTNDYGSVIEAVNDRFGTDIPVFDHSDANVEKCFGLIEAKNSMFTGKITENKIARPSADRKKLNEEARNVLRQKRHAKMLQQAEELYARFIETQKRNDPVTANHS